MSADDIESATDIHFDAFVGSANTRIGRGYVRSFLKWFQLRGDTIALVSELHGAITGYVVGAQVGYERAINRDLLPIAVRGFLYHPFALFHKDILTNLRSRISTLVGISSPLSEPAPTLPEPVMSLVGIGVSTAARGDGSASSLLEAFEHESWRRGFAAVRLSVHAVNERAIRFYQRSQWTPFPVPEKGYWYFSKRVPGWQQQPASES